MFGSSKNKKYEHNMTKKDINALENYQSKMENISKRHEQYVKDVKEDDTLYKWQKQRRINKSEESLWKDLFEVSKQREQYCAERGIEKRKKKDDQYLRTGKWGYKK